MIGKSDPVCFLQVRTGGPEQPWLAAGKTGAWRSASGHARQPAHAGAPGSVASAVQPCMHRMKRGGESASASASCASAAARGRSLARFRGASLTLRATAADTVKNNLDPVWTTPFVIDFYFEEAQTLRFRRATAAGGKEP